jgi:hypothetical protein
VWEVIIYQQKFVINRYKKISINGKKDSAHERGPVAELEVLKKVSYATGKHSAAQRQ